MNAGATRDQALRGEDGFTVSVTETTSSGMAKTKDDNSSSASRLENEQQGNGQSTGTTQTSGDVRHHTTTDGSSRNSGQTLLLPSKIRCVIKDV